MKQQKGYGQRVKDAGGDPCEHRDLSAEHGPHVSMERSGVVGSLDVLAAESPCPVIGWATFREDLAGVLKGVGESAAFCSLSGRLVNHLCGPMLTLRLTSESPDDSLLNEARDRAKDLRRKALISRDASVIALEVLKDYSSQALPALLDCRQLLCRLTKEHCEWLALPHLGCPALTSFCTASHASKQGLSEDGIASLAEKWVERHEGVRAAPRMNVPCPPHSHCCWDACVCSEQPKHIWTKFKAFLSQIDMAKLQAGCVLVRWQSYFVDDDDTGAEGVGHGLPGAEYYTHLSFHMVKPFRLVMVQMELQEPDVPLEPGQARAFRTKVHDEMPTIFLLQEWICALDYTLCWDVFPLELSDRCSPQPSTNTQVAVVGEATRARVWPGVEAALRKKRRRAPLHETLAREPRTASSTMSTQAPSAQQSSDPSSSAPAVSARAGVSDSDMEVDEDIAEEAEHLLQEMADARMNMEAAASSHISHAATNNTCSSESTNSDDSDSDVILEQTLPEPETQPPLVGEPQGAVADPEQDAPAPDGLVGEGEAERAARRSHEKLFMMKKAGSTTEHHGFLKVNPSLNNMFASCAVHEDCVRTRTLNRTGRRGGKGRPVGALGAWLIAQESFTCKEAHMRFKPSFLQRQEARQRLAQQHNYPGFKEAEHPKEDRSSSEPRD